MKAEMKKQIIYNNWLLTNLFGSVTIVLIIFVLNLLLDQIEFNSRRLIQVAFGIFFFFCFWNSSDSSSLNVYTIHNSPKL